MIRVGIWTTLILATTFSIVAFGKYDYEPFGAKVTYDVMDGHGPSHARVDVIEWEGNLELHVYPKGQLAGLALKLDKKNEKKPVMIVGYRFTPFPNRQYVRRAILGISIREGFKVYKDSTDDEYDKIIISNNALQGEVVAYNLDSELIDSFPAGHPDSKALAEAKPDKEGKKDRGIASNKSAETSAKKAPAEEQEPTREELMEQSGSIKAFKF